MPKCCQSPEEVDYEVELGIVIGKRCKNCSREDALSHVLGYVVCNDVSARLWQQSRCGSQWCFGKSFDTFCPVGPCLATGRVDPSNLRVTTSLNGRVVQDSSTSDLIFDVPAIIEHCSMGTTLAPGTLILTGTPEGVGMGKTPPEYLRHGDAVSVAVAGVGACANDVVYE